MHGRLRPLTTANRFSPPGCGCTNCVRKRINQTSPCAARASEPAYQGLHAGWRDGLYRFAQFRSALCLAQYGMGVVFNSPALVACMDEIFADEIRRTMSFELEIDKANTSSGSPKNRGNQGHSVANPMPPSAGGSSPASCASCRGIPALKTSVRLTPPAATHAFASCICTSVSRFWLTRQ